MAFVAWRATFGFLAISVIVALVARRRGASIADPRRLPRRDLAGLVVIALAGLGVNIAAFIAFDLTTVAVVLLAFYTYPALVAVVAVALGHERLDGSRLVALGLALGGMVLVVAGGLGASGTGAAFNPVGVLLGLAAAIFQTTFVTVSRGRFATVTAEQAMGWVTLVTAVTCLVIAIGLGDRLDVPLHDTRALGLAMLAGIAGAGIPSVFEPLVEVSLAALLLHEAVRPIQAVGGAAILVAALLLQRRAPAAAPELGVAVAERT